jgi:hypothetical protein
MNPRDFLGSVQEVQHLELDSTVISRARLTNCGQPADVESSPKAHGGDTSKVDDTAHRYR